MKLSQQIKPISYLKAHAAEIIRELNTDKEPIIITQNGEAKAIIQDLASYEATQATLALLKILALGQQQAQNNQVKNASEVFKAIRNKQRDTE